jgi:HlyD family secretion protein
MKRIYLYIIIGIIVVGTAGYFLLWNSSSNEVKYRTDKVTRGDIVQQVRATGTINPVQTVQVGSQVSGTIQKMYVDFNSRVHKGQIIAQIDSTFLYAAVKQAEANVERNQAQVNDAKRTLTRNTELFSKNLVSQADLDAATTAYEAALAQLKQTQAALDQAKVNLQYAIIRSPIDGVVISRDVDVGQTVASSFQTPQLFQIANDLTHMQVEASIDEADIGQIADGQAVTFTVDAYPGQEFHGKVSQVRLSPVTVQNVVTYTVIIDVPNPDLKLRPGMTATVSVLINERKDALRVPTLAIRFQPPQDVLESFQQQYKGGMNGSAPDSMQRARWMQRSNQLSQGEGGSGERHFGGGMMQRDPSGATKAARVWVLVNGKDLKPVFVRTGINDNRYVEIASRDLKEGDDVVIGMTASDMANGAQQNPFGPRMMMGGRGR